MWKSLLQLVRSRSVSPGDRRAEFLKAASVALELDGASPDPSANLSSAYGADEMQVYECVQRAQEIWQVQLLPQSIPVDAFPQMIGKFTSLRAIIEAAESAAS